MKLSIRVRQMQDGRFKVSYCWHWWEYFHIEYFDNAEEVGIFLAELTKKTKWKYQCD